MLYRTSLLHTKYCIYAFTVSYIRYSYLITTQVNCHGSMYILIQHAALLYIYAISRIMRLYVENVLP